MQNSNGGWGDVGSARKQTQKSDVDSVLDAFNNILAANSDGILPTTAWGNKKGEYEPRGSEISSRPTRGGAYNSATSNQDESENSWSSWGNNSWDTNSGWGNDDNNVRNYPTNNSEYQNSTYADDREYKDMNRDMDTIRPNPGINSNRPNQNDNHIDMYMDNDSQSGNWPTSKRPQSSQEINSPSESDSSTDHNSETIEQNSVQMKISAWHNLAEPNAKEIKEDSVGAGQLHRRGRAFIPVPEETVLAIQNGGIKKNRRGPEKSKIRGAPNVPQNQVGKPPMKPSQKSSTPLKSDIKAPIKTSVPPNQRPNTQPIPPNRTQQQIQQKPPPPSQSSQPQSSWDSSKLSWDDNSIPSQHQQPQRSQQSQQSQQPQRSQQSQQPQKPQQPQQPQKPQQLQQSQKPQQPQQPQKSQDSWDNNLVNEPFWDMPSKTSPNVQNQPQSNSSPRQYANEVATTGGQYRSPRHQSPARSPRPAKSSLPYIPPEFDSTPYRRQRTPSPNRDNFNGYNNNNNNNNSEWGAGRVYEDDDQQNEYYEDSDFEERDDKFSGYGNRLRDRKDRGQLLLTINVEFEEGKTQAIKVHVNDDPLDLAKDFCDLFKVTNDMVMPALECLIKEEKEKRLGSN